MEFPVYVAFLVILDTPPEFFKHFVGEQKGIQFFHRGENNIFPGVHSDSLAALPGRSVYSPFSDIAFSSKIR